MTTLEQTYQAKLEEFQQRRIDYGVWERQVLDSVQTLKNTISSVASQLEGMGTGEIVTECRQLVAELQDFDYTTGNLEEAYTKLEKFINKYEKQLEELLKNG